MPDPDENKSIPKLTQTGRYIIIFAAFLGWFFGGMHLGITSLSMGSAAKDLLRGTEQFEVTAGDQAAAQKQPKTRYAAAFESRRRLPLPRTRL